MVALAAALIAWWRIPPAVPVVESVTQLTDDGEPKRGTLVSDGSRIYFNEGQTGSWKIAQVSVTGGRTALIETSLANPRIAGLAPDGSALLALVGGRMLTPPPPLWSIPLPAGEPRRLGSVEGQDADFSRMVASLVAREKDLYVADKDGSNLRKLASLLVTFGDPAFHPMESELFSLCSRPTQTSLVEIAADGTDLRTIAQRRMLRGMDFRRESISCIDHASGASQIFGLFPCIPGLLHGQENPFDLPPGRCSTPEHARAAMESRSSPSAPSDVANWFAMT